MSLQAVPRCDTSETRRGSFRLSQGGTLRARPTVASHPLYAGLLCGDVHLSPSPFPTSVR